MHKLMLLIQEQEVGKSNFKTRCRGKKNFIVGSLKSPGRFFLITGLLTFSLITVVDECRQRLLAAGFIELKEAEQWDIKPASKVSHSQDQIFILHCCSEFQ